MKPKKILITGGAGFIGSHLTDECLKRGHEVIVMDDFSVGRLENLEAHRGNTRLTIVKADISQGDLIQHSFKGVNWVFHLAARADIVPSIQKPQLYHRVNVDGTIAVLEAARTKGVERFIYAASSSCYGIANQFPTTELAPIQPEYPYALTKTIAEQYVLHWEKVYGMSALSLRLFNVFGPRVRTNGTYGAVFGVFLAQKANNLPFTVVGDGNQTRDFTYVSDVVSALMMAAESHITGEILNVGSGGSYSVNQLVKLMGGDVTYIPKRPGEPEKTFADISKIRKLLGWKPQVRFEDGVATMLSHLSQWKSAPLWTPEKIEVATKDWFQYLGSEV